MSNGFHRNPVQPEVLMPQGAVQAAVPPAMRFSQSIQPIQPINPQLLAPSIRPLQLDVESILKEVKYFAGSATVELEVTDTIIVEL